MSKKFVGFFSYETLIKRDPAGVLGCSATFFLTVLLFIFGLEKLMSFIPEKMVSYLNAQLLVPF